VAFSGIRFVTNFMKIGQLVEKLKGDKHTHTHTHKLNCDLVDPKPAFWILLSFLRKSKSFWEK
jgi:hypothetical protein